MSTRLVIGAGFFFVEMAGVLIANLTLFTMVELVNHKRPNNQQISQLFWHFGKIRHVVSEYQSYYPSGTLKARYKVAIATMVVGLIGAGSCLI